MLLSVSCKKTKQRKKYPALAAERILNPHCSSKISIDPTADSLHSIVNWPEL